MTGIETASLIISFCAIALYCISKYEYTVQIKRLTSEVEKNAFDIRSINLLRQRYEEDTDKKLMDIDKALTLSEESRELTAKAMSDMNTEIANAKHSTELLGRSIATLIEDKKKAEEKIAYLEKWKEETNKLLENLSVPEEKELSEAQALFEKAWQKYVEDVTGYNLEKAYSAVRGKDV